MLKFEIKKVFSKARNKVAVLVLLVVLALGASIYIFSLDQVVISNNIVTITNSFKIIMSAICILMVIILFIVMYFYKRKLSKPDYYLFNLWVIAVVLVEMIVVFILTPYWLQAMYGIPFMLSLFFIYKVFFPVLQLRV